MKDEYYSAEECYRPGRMSKEDCFPPLSCVLIGIREHLVAKLEQKRDFVM